MSSGRITCSRPASRSKTRPASSAGSVHCPCGMRVTAALVPCGSANPRLQEAVICAYFNGIAFKQENRVTLNTYYVLSEYIENALDKAEYEKLEDGSYSGSIPVCPG